MADFDTLKESALTSLKNPGKSKEPMPKASTDEPPMLYVFRHCETYDNARRIFSGRRQSTLTPQGCKQAQHLAQKLKEKSIDLFISPSLKRCTQTLQPLQVYFPRVPLLIKKELVERDYGVLTGKSKLTAMRQYPKEAVLWRRSWDVSPPQGESLKQVWEQRVEPFCTWLVAKMKKERCNVGYSGTNNTIRLIRMYFEHLGRDEMLSIENAYADYASYHIAA